MKKILFFFLTLLLGLTLVGCGKDKDKTTDLVKDKDWMLPGEMISEYLSDENKKVSEIKMTLVFNDEDGLAYIGYMRFVVFKDLAPITVNNFVKLVEEHYYDNLTITRVVRDQLMQGGDPEKTTLKEPKEITNTIKGEFEQNEVFNNLSHDSGVLSMARAEDNDSASSQFFVVNSNFTSGNGTYAAFGFLLKEKNEDGSALTNEQRNYTMTDDGRRVLYDYDCLSKICSIALENDAQDAAPVDTIEIKEAVLLQKDVKMSDIR